MNGVDSEKLFDIDGFWHKNQRPQPWEQATTDIAENEDFLIVLSDCLQKLPAPLQTAVQLKYFEEKKGEVICQELNLSPTNFWQIIHRAKLRLRKCLEINWLKQQGK